MLHGAKSRHVSSYRYAARRSSDWPRKARTAQMARRRIRAQATRGRLRFEIPAVSPSASPELTRLRRNWQAEHDSAALYGAFARFARDPDRRRLYQDLASAERRHAAFWEERLRALGQTIPSFRPSLRTSVLIQLTRALGVGFVVPSVIAREMRDQDHYIDQQDARAAGLAHEEHGHAAVLRLESAVSFGNNLRAAVLGANDGLASNFCLMMGVAGAGASATTL